MPDYKEVFTYTDQPTTCPKCGARTLIISEEADSPLHTQHHRCLSVNCCFEFVMQEDIDDRETVSIT